MTKIYANYKNLLGRSGFSPPMGLKQIIRKNSVKHKRVSAIKKLSVEMAMKQNQKFLQMVFNMWCKRTRVRKLQKQVCFGEF